MPTKYIEDEQEYYDLLELASYLCLQWRLARPPSKGGRISKASSCTRDLIRQHINAGKSVFTTCTGSTVLASTGLLDGKKATINHAGYKWAKENYPAVN